MFVPLRVPRYDDPHAVTWGQVTIDAARCDGCNLCVRICPADSLELEAHRCRMRTTGALVACIACGDCTAVCPQGAIELTRSYRYSGSYQTQDRGALALPRL